MGRKKIEMIQVHGKEEKFAPTTLEQVWGETGISKYKTLDEEEYTKSLNDMNKADLQSHAVKIGIVPTDNRDLLTRKLLKEFRTFVASFKIPRHTPQTNKLSSKAQKILSEGR